MTTRHFVGQVFSLSNEELEKAAEAHTKPSEPEPAAKEAPSSSSEQPRVRLEEDLNNACSIACGAAHVAVATDSGAVYTYGSGRLGQLGHGDKKAVEEPRLVEALRDRHVTRVACGRDHTVAVTEAGEVFFWGNRVDFVGSGSVTAAEVLPVRVESLTGVVIRQIACGAFHTAVLAEDGAMYVWGEYQADRSCRKCNHPDPYLISPLIRGKIVSIACGPHQTIAITEDHKVWTWGGGVLKQPTEGYSDQHGPHLPAPVEALDGYKVVQMACGDFNLAGVTVHGEVVIAHDVNYFKNSTRYGRSVSDSKPHRVEATTLKPLFGIRMLQVVVYRNTAVGVAAFGSAFTWTLPDPWRDFKNETNPIKIDALDSIVVAQVACGGEQTAILADENTFLATHLKLALDAPQFADVRIVVDGHHILAHKCILAARCQHWRALSSLPADQLDGFRWDRDCSDGVDTLTFPTVADDLKGHVRGREGYGGGFSYPIVLALLRYVYTDKIVLPEEFVHKADKGKDNVVDKKKRKNTKNKNEEEEEEGGGEDDAKAKRERKEWYEQLERAAQYFGLIRLVRLCQRGTRECGFDMTVPASSIADELGWLVEPQLAHYLGVDNDALGEVSTDYNIDSDEQEVDRKWKDQEEERRRCLGEVDEAMGRIEADYARVVDRARERYIAQTERMLNGTHGNVMSPQERKLRQAHVMQMRNRIMEEDKAKAEKAKEIVELREKERREAENEIERHMHEEKERKKLKEEEKKKKEIERHRHEENEREKGKEQDERKESEEVDVEEVMVKERCADVKFVVGGENLWAHKLVITSACEYFRLMFASGMRESELGEVVLDEAVEPAVFAHLLAFLYTDSLAGIDANTAIDLIAIADQFMLPRMKRICEIRTQKDIDVNNVAYVFQGADMYQAGRLRGFCLGFMTRNFEKVSQTDTFAALPPDLAAEVRTKAKAMGAASGAAQRARAAQPSVQVRRALPSSSSSPSPPSSSSSSATTPRGKRGGKNGDCLLS